MAHAILTGTLALAAVVGVGEALSFPRNRPMTMATGAPIGGPFTLVDGDGRAVTDRDFRGKYLLVYFGYTTCPDVCPTTLNEVSVAMRRLGPDAARVRPVFVTLDPRRDTPQVVRDYAAAFYPRMVGLTGTPRQIADVAEQFRVASVVHRTGPGPDDYTIDHSSMLYLVGPDGQFVAPIRADQPGAAMATEIAHDLS